MYCRICGSREEDKPKWFEGKWVELYLNKGQALCRPCAAETPDKVCKSEFIKFYFDGDETVPANITKEFYSDYLASTQTLAEYKASTVSFA